MSDLFRLLVVLMCHCCSLILIQAISFECQSTDSCGCSRNNVDINPRIVNGEIVAYRSWNWAVSIRDSYNVHICGGTILSQSFVLTAAHCFRRVLGEYLSYSVAMGVDSLMSTTGQIRTVTQIFIHPKWNFTSKENDIAILQLNSPISMDDMNVAKICLPEVSKSQQERYPVLHSSLVAIGWSITTWEGLISPMHLRQVTLEAIDSIELKCNNIIKNIHLQFCAGVKGAGGKETCEGDSGGPIMHFSTTWRRWILTGIISYGYHCTLRDYAGVYTRISVYLDWIQSIVDDDGIVTVEESRAIVRHTSNTAIIISLSLISFVYFVYFSHVHVL